MEGDIYDADLDHYNGKVICQWYHENINGKIVGYFKKVKVFLGIKIPYGKEFLGKIIKNNKVVKL